MKKLLTTSHQRKWFILLTVISMLLHLLMKVSSSFKLEDDPSGRYQRDPLREDFNIFITEE